MVVSTSCRVTTPGALGLCWPHIQKRQRCAENAANRNSTAWGALKAKKVPFLQRCLFCCPIFIVSWYISGFENEVHNCSS